MKVETTIIQETFLFFIDNMRNSSLAVYLVLFSSLFGLVQSETSQQKALPERAFNKKKSSDSNKNERVKWTSGDNSGAHASAPRSQKYWDEHNLNKNKPDYAKTDAEVFFERYGYHQPSDLSVMMKDPKNIAIAVISLMALYISFTMLPSHRIPSSGGQVLGSGTESSTGQEMREQERQMRLAKFESTDVKKVTYNEAMAQAMGKDID